MAGDQGWSTPIEVVAALQKILKVRFTLDAAASKRNAKCARYYTEADDGLAKPWRNATFCNPPFLGFGDWIEKAAHEAQEREIESVLIGPAGCSQSWFHEWARFATCYAPTRRLAFLHSQDGVLRPQARADAMIYHYVPGARSKCWRVLPIDLPR